MGSFGSPADWANKQSLALICEDCGHIEEFLGDVLKLNYVRTPRA